MNIGIIGSGNVGGTLGTRWAKGGHQVIFGSRDPGAGDMKELLARAGSNARGAKLQDLAKSGDVLLLAMPWPVTKEVAQGLGDLTGKVLIDATNLRCCPIFRHSLSAPPLQPASRWPVGCEGAKVVKAFNTVGSNIMENPVFETNKTGQEKLVLFFCGDDAGAKGKVKQLAGELGFEGVDAGPLTQARLLEPFALLWISLAFKAGLGREFAFKLLRR
jgi:predicted dinucleotide-binding enzyme